MNVIYKSITPRNDKGQHHGVWEMYWFNGDLLWRCFYHNGKEIGYEEYYSYIGKISKKNYYI